MLARLSLLLQVFESILCASSGPTIASLYTQTAHCQFFNTSYLPVMQQQTDSALLLLYSIDTAPLHRT